MNEKDKLFRAFRYLIYLIIGLFLFYILGFTLIYLLGAA